MKKICVLFSIITIATASLNTETDNLLSTALRFVRDCGDKSMLLCAKVSKTNTKSKEFFAIIISGFKKLEFSLLNLQKET